MLELMLKAIEGYVYIWTTMHTCTHVIRVILLNKLFVLQTKEPEKKKKEDEEFSVRGLITKAINFIVSLLFVEPLSGWCIKYLGGICWN